MRATSPALLLAAACTPASPPATPSTRPAKPADPPVLAACAALPSIFDVPTIAWLKDPPPTFPCEPAPGRAGWLTDGPMPPPRVPPPIAPPASVVVAITGDPAPAARP